MGYYKYDKYFMIASNDAVYLGHRPDAPEAHLMDFENPKLTSYDNIFDPAEAAQDWLNAIMPAEFEKLTRSNIPYGVKITAGNYYDVFPDLKK